MAASMESGLTLFEELKRLEQVYKADATDLIVSFGSPGGALGTYHLRGVSGNAVPQIRDYVTRLAKKLDIENLTFVCGPVQMVHINDLLKETKP